MDEKSLTTEAIQTLRKYFELHLGKQAFDLYVPPQGRQDKPVDVLEQVRTLVLNSPKLSLLILGDSGLGKSTFAKYLTQFLWNSYGQTHNWIPLFIYLPLIPEKERTSQLLESFFKSQGLNEAHLAALKNQCSLVLILDGYDEIPSTGNLWIQNHWPIENIKVITFCRQEALANLRSDNNHYHDLFYPPLGNRITKHESYSEIELTPFNDQQINDYLIGYDKAIISEQTFTTTLNWQDYRQKMDEINGLNELIRIPFILSLVRKILPALLKELSTAQDKEEHFLLTRTKLYDYFIQCWFAYQAERIIAHKELPTQLGELSDILLLYMQNLAHNQLKKRSLLSRSMEEKETLDRSLLYPYPRDSRDEQYYQLVNSLSDHQLKLIRSGCLLTTDGDQFRFLHSSILEYLTARDLFEGLMGKLEFLLQDSLKNEFGFNQRPLTSSPAILHMLADRVKDEPKFKERLFEIVEYSKKSSYVSIAAANAITILNYAQVPLSNKNFQGIQIPQADLSYALLQNTDFGQANLENVAFHHAYLENASFYKSYLKGASFGQEPMIHKKLFYAGNDTSCSRFSNLFYSNDGQYLIILFHCSPQWTWIINENPLPIEVLSLYDVNKKQIVQKIELKLERSGKCTDEIIDACFHPKQHLLIVGTQFGFFYFWDIEKGNCIKTLKGESWLKSMDLSMDGRWLACVDGWRISLLDVEKQQWDVVLSGHNDKVSSLHFSPDGHWLASGSYANARVCLWNLQEQSCTVLDSENKDDILLSVRFSSNSRRLAIANRDRIHLYNVKKQCCDIIFEDGGYSTIHFSPDDRWVAFIKNDKLSLWDVKKRSCVTSFAGSFSALFSPDSRWLALGSNEWLALESNEGTIQLWDLQKYHYAASLKLYNGLTTMTFSPNGQKLASAGYECIQLWDLNRETQKIYPNLTGKARISKAVFSEDSKWLVTRTVANTIELWSTEKQICTKILDSSVYQEISSISDISALTISSDGAWSACDTHRNQIFVWSWKPQSHQLPFKLDINIKTSWAKKIRIKSLEFSPDGQWLVAIYRLPLNPTLYENYVTGLWDLKKQTPFILAGIKNLSDFTRNAKYIPASAYLHISPLGVQKPPPRLLPEYKSIRRKSSPDGRWFIHEGWLQHYSVDKTPIKSFKLSDDFGHILDVCFLSNSQFILVNQACQFYLWQLPSTPDEKPYLVSVPRGGWPLVCSNLNIEKAIGFAEEKYNTETKSLLGSKSNEPKKFDTSKIELLHQLGATGKPSLKQKVTDSSVAVEDILLNTQSVHAAVAIVNQFSLAKRPPTPSLPLAYDQWIISLLRVPKHRKLSSHRFLVLEGFNDLGKAFFIEMHLYEDLNNPPYGLITMTTYLEKDLTKSRQELFDELLINFNNKGDELPNTTTTPYFESNSWSITRSQGRQLIEDIKKDQTKKIGYLLTANTSFFAPSRQVPTEGTVHNCFSWARKKLLNLNDPNIQVPSKLYLDYIAEAAIPNSSLPEQEGAEAQQNNSPCLIL